MRLWYLLHRRPAKAQACLRIHAVSPEPSLFAHIGMEVDKGSDQKSASSHTACKAAHARLGNEFTEDGKCHNLMRWLISDPELILIFLTTVSNLPPA